jgi:hypothetical protein
LGSRAISRLVVTMWRKGAKWDNMEEILFNILLRVEYFYGALFGGDHIKSPFLKLWSNRIQTRSPKPKWNVVVIDLY